MGARVVVSDLRYERGGREILKGISLEVEAGSVAAVVGPNGAGKSTLLKIVSGYLRPKSGCVDIGGKDPGVLSPFDRSRLVTYCGDEPDPAFAFTVGETVEMGRVLTASSRGRDSSDAENGGAGSCEAAMAALNILHLRDRAITTLSSGERQRVYIARSIFQDPLVFLLDEPTTHLDMTFEIQVTEMIRRLADRGGKTVLTVVHDLNLALRSASRLIFLKDGMVAYSVSPEEVSAEIIHSVYGVNASVERHPVLGTTFVLPPIGTEQ